MSDVKTTVSEVSDKEIEDLLDIGGDIMLPGEEKKPNVFSNTAPDTTFLDKPPVEGEDDVPPVPPTEPPVEPVPPAEPPVDPTEPPVPPVEPAEPVIIPQPGEDPVPEDKNKGGRPTAMIAAAKSLIEKKILMPFDDGKKIEDYTQADLEEMIEANFNQNKENYKADLPEQFFKGMPAEMQQAYQYIANGGQDIKGLFQSMASSHEIKDLDISTENGQLYAVRTYLQAINYGDGNAIEEEIQAYQDRGELEKKAGQFKPKLDDMQSNVVNQRLASQEAQEKVRHEQSQKYMENVYNVLETGKLGTLELDSKTQDLLYSGLVQPNYPSVSGKQTNLLGHLLEKYQWVEPNHELIAEALWLLADPDGYRGEIAKGGKAAAVEDTVRKLKTAQDNLQSSTAQDEPAPAATPARKAQTIARPKRSFFGR